MGPSPLSHFLLCLLFYLLLAPMSLAYLPTRLIPWNFLGQQAFNNLMEWVPLQVCAGNQMGKTWA